MKDWKANLKKPAIDSRNWMRLKIQSDKSCRHLRSLLRYLKQENEDLINAIILTFELLIVWN